MTDQGAQRRTSILEQAAKRTILDLLSTHGWVATIIGRHEEDSGYLIIEAQRASAKHRVALLYTSAVANVLYKALENRVEVIFINGDLYHVEEYAHGIKTPVKPAHEFFSTLLEWNQGVSPGKLAVDFKDVVGARPKREYQTIRSENPIQQIWSELDQLGSVQLAKNVVRERGTLDEASLLSKAVGLAYSIRNASDYFRTSQVENISQRILSRYYGSLAFASAELLAAPNGATTLAEIEDSTKFGHGLYTVDARDGNFPELTVGPLSRGFFPKWAKSLGLDTSFYPAKKPSVAAELSGISQEAFVTVRDLFARTPEVGDLFLDIFDSAHRWVTPVYDNKGNASHADQKESGGTYALLIDRSCRLEGADVAKLKVPLSQIQFMKTDGQGRYFRGLVNRKGFDVWWEAIGPIHHSPFIGMTGALILPLFGAITEFRVIMLVLLYSLSIVVRYRPSLWRRIQEADWDHYKVLIYATLDVIDRVLPQEFLQSITGRRIHSAQPGSFLA